MYESSHSAKLLLAVQNGCKTHEDADKTCAPEAYQRACVETAVRAREVLSLHSSPACELEPHACASKVQEKAAMQAAVVAPAAT